MPVAKDEAAVFHCSAVVSLTPCNSFCRQLFRALELLVLKHNTSRSHFLDLTLLLFIFQAVLSEEDFNWLSFVCDLWGCNVDVMFAGINQPLRWRPYTLFMPPTACCAN